MLSLILRTILSSLKSRRSLALENLALRHQLDVLTRTRRPPHLTNRERVIGSVRRECLYHVIVLNRRHLRRILMDYFEYYWSARPESDLC